MTADTRGVFTIPGKGVIFLVTEKAHGGVFRKIFDSLFVTSDGSRGYAASIGGTKS